MANNGSILNYALIGIGAYLVYEYFFTTPTASTVPSAPGAPAGTTTPTTTSTPPPTNTPIGTYAQCQAQNAALQASGSNALLSCNTYPGAPTITYPPPPPPPPPATTSIGGVAYSGTKNSYNQALMHALLNAAGGTASGLQSIDTWNWYMVNTFGALSVGPDPTVVAAQIGIGRSDSTDPASYINALSALGMINYPSGLTGLSALADGVARLNKHPLAGYRVRNFGRGVVQ